VVPAGDASALAEALQALAADPQASVALGQAGRESVGRRFSLQAMVSAYEGVYEQVLQTPVKWSE
jgi:glycosyltransferase involved in cell wall biosynthesis